MIPFLSYIYTIMNDWHVTLTVRLWRNFTRTGDIQDDLHSDPDDDCTCQYGAAVCLRQVRTYTRTVNNRVFFLFGSSYCKTSIFSSIMSNLWVFVICCDCNQIVPANSKRLFAFSVAWDRPIVRFGSGQAHRRYYTRFFGQK